MKTGEIGRGMYENKQKYIWYSIKENTTVRIIHESPETKVFKCQKSYI